MLGHHDNLGGCLHSCEFQDNPCGSMSWTNPSFALGLPGTEQRPTYCCSECPTLKAALAAGSIGPFRLAGTSSSATAPALPVAVAVAPPARRTFLDKCKDLLKGN